jgi:adapter protein MecA 1/2
MKMERLGHDKIRIFLTFDDLVERGIQKDEIWHEIPKMQQLFSDMMEQAYSELGFEASGPLAVEVHALPAQGMVIYVTRAKPHFTAFEGEDPEYGDEEDAVYEMEVTLEHTDVITFAFADFEDVIRAARAAGRLVPDGGSLYAYGGKWVLQFEPDLLSGDQGQTLISILSEYGEATGLTQAVLEEYGKTVFKGNAVSGLARHFA